MVSARADNYALRRPRRWPTGADVRGLGEKDKSVQRGDRSSMIRRYSVLLVAALVAAPFIGSGSAGAAGTVIGQCTSVKGSTHLVPGLGHDKKSQTGTSPDTGGTSPTPDTFSGCSQTGGGGPSSATF